MAYTYYTSRHLHEVNFLDALLLRQGLFLDIQKNSKLKPNSEETRTKFPKDSKKSANYARVQLPEQTYRAITLIRQG